MRDLETDIVCALRSDLNVLITGEAGVGKKFVACRIHQQSSRAPEPFVVVRSEVLESVGTRNCALLRAAPGGTVVVEDVERMTAPMQSRLLRFLEGRTARSRGNRQFVERENLRFITATSRDLFELVRFHQFHDALFYRLNAIHLMIPPLRDRREDIRLLLDHYLSLYARATVPRLSTAAWQRLVTYPWPGNVPQLKVVAETLASRDLPRPFEPDDLPTDIGR